jgi:hypothetical protein
MEFLSTIVSLLFKDFPKLEQLSERRGRIDLPFGFELRRALDILLSRSLAPLLVAGVETLPFALRRSPLLLCVHIRAARTCFPFSPTLAGIGACFDASASAPAIRTFGRRLTMA